MPVYPGRDNGPVKPGDYPRSAMRGQYTSAEFAGPIAALAGRPVIDKSGLTEKYSIFVYYAPPAPPSGPPPEFEAPDFFTAIQQQLGFKRESGKDNVEVVVVDHMERTPTEN
jgi:uncharacterized protein (TIGR03435 family)